MLPSAKSALQVGGFSSKAASFTLIACFLGGAAGIQIVSSLFHRCLPSHVVDCDHYHEDEDPDQETAHKDSETSHHPEFPHAQHDHDQIHSSGPEVQMTNGVKDAILARNGAHTYAAKPLSSESRMDPLSGRRPSLQKRLSRGVSKVLSAGKDQCDDDGPCRGFSEPCGQECFNNVFRKGSLRSSVGILRHPGMGRSTTQPATVQTFIPTVDEHQPLLQDRDNALGLITSAPTPEQLSSEQITSLNSHPDSHFSPISSDRSPLLRRASHHSHLSQHSDSHSHHRPSLTVHPSHQPSTQHHHHVPTNPYLTLSLQTTLAIALHKLPEGFITYAANHASPRLGFTVFFSLFIHNISEGFAMALPLYLALHSRWKAICWSSILGGLSQPLGAGVAALWFGVAGKFAGNEGDENDGQGLQGGLIAVTGKSQAFFPNLKYRSGLRIFVFIRCARLA